MIKLFNYIRNLQTSSFVLLNKTIMEYLFKEELESYISSKMLPHQSAKVLTY